jgi:hypothetical protein
MHSFSRWLCIILVVLGWFAREPARGRETIPTLDWQTFDVPEYGTKIDYPAGIFAPAGAPEKGVGKRFETTDGRAILSVYGRDNGDGDTPASYLNRYLRVGQATLDYRRITQSFFAVSMERDGLIYYSRCNFSRGPVGGLHCFDLVYPEEEKRAWDPVVTRLSLSLRPIEGAHSERK